MDVAGSASARFARAGAHSHQKARRLLRAVPGARGLRVRGSARNRARGSGAPGGVENEARGARATAAVLAVRKEGRGGRGRCEAQAARRGTVAAQVIHARRSRPAGKRSQMARRGRLVICGASGPVRRYAARSVRLRRRHKTARLEWTALRSRGGSHTALLQRAPSQDVGRWTGGHNPCIPS
jgi:hypothetical protein